MKQTASLIRPGERIQLPEVPDFILSKGFSVASLAATSIAQFFYCLLAPSFGTPGIILSIAGVLLAFRLVDIDARKGGADV